MVYVVFSTRLFQVIPDAPNRPARVWTAGEWQDSFLTNGEVLRFGDVRLPQGTAPDEQPSLATPAG